MLSRVTSDASHRCHAIATPLAEGSRQRRGPSIDKSGTLTDGDVQIEDDVFIAAGHSFKDNPSQGEPAVLPPVGNGADPGGAGHGVGTND